MNLREDLRRNWRLIAVCYLVGMWAGVELGFIFATILLLVTGNPPPSTGWAMLRVRVRLRGLLPHHPVSPNNPEVLMPMYFSPYEDFVDRSEGKSVDAVWLICPAGSLSHWTSTKVRGKKTTDKQWRELFKHLRKDHGDYVLLVMRGHMWVPKKRTPAELLPSTGVHRGPLGKAR